MRYYSVALLSGHFPFERSLTDEHPDKLAARCTDTSDTYRIVKNQIKELYAKVASHPLTALKTSSKCSFIHQPGRAGTKIPW
uniref:Uncharacterized protein n=1 Tax=Candidatus Kentrum sp. DK TaxID=2126562 RepID=A0A450SFW2_9GAMM|nr:MAG: hypothetical protein BECKDK2373C_GA0170839_10336 [Candidatus Kentron sp. DK]VFJ53821.1 MAG: hypothetical protein BECKDK2373B_GA0170837_10441 [Candidatus Kentron sp. DK]